MTSDVGNIVTPIPYATPAHRPATRAWMCFGIMFSGLVLIGLGGCFLVGVLCIVNPAIIFGPQQSPPASLPAFDIALMIVLYLLAAASFAGAIVLVFIGTRAMLRIIAAK